MRFVQPRETRIMLEEYDRSMAAIQRDRERWAREKGTPRSSSQFKFVLAANPPAPPASRQTWGDAPHGFGRPPVVRVPTEETLRFRFALLDRKFPSPPARLARPTAARVVCPACSTGSVAMTAFVSCPGCGAILDRRGQVVA